PDSVMTGRAGTDAAAEKPLVYSMRPEGCQENGRADSTREHFLQIIEFKLFSTYTGPVKSSPALAAISLLSVLAIAPAPLQSQALPRTMYVSVVDQSGAPADDLGPSDFVVREDNLAREV